MVVRQLQVADRHAIADLENQLFDGRFDAENLRAMIEKSAFYGVVLHGMEATMLVRSYCLSYITSDHVEILALGTHKKWQGCGFGRMILGHLIEVIEQKRVKKITLEVAADNILAKRLYYSAGFAKVGCRKNYYQRGEIRCDAVIMARLGV